jgi:hypothetical protein
VPLPDVALEGGLGVELELVDVDVLAEILLQRPTSRGWLTSRRNTSLKVWAGEGGARRAGLLAPDLLAVGLEDLLALDAQQRDLLLGEAVRQEDIALIVEGFELVGVKAASRAPETSGGRRGQGLAPSRRRRPR